MSYFIVIGIKLRFLFVLLERYGFLWPLIGSLIVLVLLALVIIFAELRQRRKERKQRAD